MSAIDIFKTHTNNAFTTYHAELVVREKLIGGIPKDPDTIKKWLAARLEMEDRAVLELAEQTAAQMQEEKGERPTGDELLTAVAREFEGGNGFKTINGQLVYEGRCMKACLKEAANVAYPGTAFPGKKEAFGDGFRKGLMRALAERVFVVDDYIGLGVSEPSGTEQRIKHVQTPQGPRSAINVVDYVAKPHLSFTVKVLGDFLPQRAWGAIWQSAEEIGIGADRARSDGRFDLLVWEKA